MPTVFYQNCRCPHCKARLDQLPESTPLCPTCNQPLDPRQVWETRSYPGQLLLPAWVSAFTWPLLLMIAGLPLFFMGRPVSRLGGLLFALGFVYFLFKLFGGDD